MAKLEFPLFSNIASGPVLGLFSFKTVNGRAVVASPRKKTRSKSVRLRKNRAFFKSVISDWNSLSVAEKLIWKRNAPSNLSGFAYFLKTFGSPYRYAFRSFPLIDSFSASHSSENVGLLGASLYLLPGFSSGFAMFGPLYVSDIKSFSLFYCSSLSAGVSGASVQFFGALAPASLVPPDLSVFSEFFVGSVFPGLSPGFDLSSFVFWFYILFSL